MNCALCAATRLLHCLAAGPRRHRDRIGELEGHNRFRLQHNLLAFSGCGYARSGARSSSSAYRRAFTATEDTAQDCSSGCSTADFGGCALTSAVAGLAPLVSLNAVAPAIHTQSRELQGQYRLPRKTARGLHFHHPAFHICGGRDYRLVVNRNRRRDRTVKNVAYLRLLGTQLFINADTELRARGNRYLLRRWRRS